MLVMMHLSTLFTCLYLVRCLGTPPVVSAIFTKGKNSHDFMFACLEEEAVPVGGQLFKEKICSYRSKFFPLRVDLY